MQWIRDTCCCNVAPSVFAHQKEQYNVTIATLYCSGGWDYFCLFVTLWLLAAVPMTMVSSLFPLTVDRCENNCLKGYNHAVIGHSDHMIETHSDHRGLCCMPRRCTWDGEGGNIWEHPAKPWKLPLMPFICNGWSGFKSSFWTTLEGNCGPKLL